MLKFCKALLMSAVLCVFAYALVMGLAVSLGFTFNTVLIVAAPLTAVACACMLFFGALADRLCRKTRKRVRYIAYFEKPVVPGSRFSYIYEIVYPNRAEYLKAIEGAPSYRQGLKRAC